MNTQPYKLLTLAAALAVVGTSCSKDTFLDVNNNPNNPIAAAPGVLLTNVEVVTGFNMGNEVNRTGSILVQHLAGAANQSATTDTYDLRGAGFADDAWNRFYSGSIINCNKLIEAGGRAQSPAYVGIAKLQKAYCFAVLTDCWGNVPYSQAAMGLDLIQPRFDKQEDIYKGTADIKSLFDLVREGLNDLDQPIPTSSIRPSSADDPVYNGDLVKWRKMGNTLLLKLANTINRREPALSASIIAEVLAKNTMTTQAYITANSDDYQVPFGATIGNQNPLQYFNYNNRPSDQILSQRLLDSMAVRNDPRLPFFFTTTPTRTATVNTTGTNTTVGTFTGYQNNSGLAIPTLASGNRSRIGVYQTGANGEAPIRMITNFQRAFILAEYYLSINDLAKAQTFYTEAITASMTKAGVPAATVSTYLTANPSVATLRGSAIRMLNQIITQKWIAWVGNGYEAYNDFRRTGYPRLALVTSPVGDDPTAIPVRFPYPNSELGANSANSPGQVLTNQKVWWDID